jgi:cell division septal protein FtsQ
MTKAKGRSSGDEKKTRPAGNGKSEGQPRRRVKAVSQIDRPFDLAERAETHRRGTRGRSPLQKGGGGRGRAKDSRATQRPLPFEGIQASLMAHLRPEIFTQRLVRIGAGLLLLLLACALLMIAYNLSHGLRIFALKEVVVYRERPAGADGQSAPGKASAPDGRETGNSGPQSARPLISDREIEDEVRKMVPTGVLRVDLERIRSGLKQLEYIREVEVRRLLPDTISLRITERVPLALARLDDGVLKCIDEDGTLFGGPQLLEKGIEAPLIGGVQQEGGNAADTNRAYLASYRTLIADLDRLEPPLSPQIDEVFFNDTAGVRVILANSQTSVFLGREDYRKRLNLALDLLDAVRNRNLDTIMLFRIGDVDRLLSARRIDYINTTNANRITIGYDE